MGSGKGQIGGSEVRCEMLQTKVVISGTTSLELFCLVRVLGSTALCSSMSGTMQGSNAAREEGNPPTQIYPKMSPFKMKTALKMTLLTFLLFLFWPQESWKKCLKIRKEMRSSSSSHWQPLKTLTLLKVLIAN